MFFIIVGCILHRLWEYVILSVTSVFHYIVSILNFRVFPVDLVMWNNINNKKTFAKEISEEKVSLDTFDVFVWREQIAALARYIYLTGTGWT